MASALGETTARIVVENPPPGVVVAVQIGKTGQHSLLPVSQSGPGWIAFDVPVKAATGPDGAARLAGPAIQGPTGDRFIYVNWGTSAGQHGTAITRRAKVRIGTLTPDQILQALEPGKRLETAFAGVGKDGGPACATIPLIGGWRVAG